MIETAKKIFSLVVVFLLLLVLVPYAVLIGMPIAMILLLLRQLLPEAVTNIIGMIAMAPIAVGVLIASSLP